MAGLDANTVLLLHCDGTNGSTAFPDATTKNIVTAHGTAQISTTLPKFGSGDAVFEVGGQSAANYLSVPDQPYFRPTGDYTIDFWTYLDNNAVESDLVGKPDNATGYCPYLILASSSGIYFFASSTDGSWDIANSVFFGSISASAWHHVAVCRSGNTYYLYVDGMLNATVSSSSTPMQQTNPLTIGARPTGFGTAGYIDEFRFSNIARWTGNQFPLPGVYTPDAGKPIMQAGAQNLDMSAVIIKPRLLVG